MGVSLVAFDLKSKKRRLMREKVMER